MTFIDRNGQDFYMPLKLNQVKKENRKKRPQTINTSGRSLTTRS